MNTQTAKYSAGDAVHSMVRETILETPPGSNRMMSAGIMVELLVERGLGLQLAKRLYSQIRKGAPLHDEWRDAFAQGRFHQRQGRATLKDARQAGATHAAVSDQEPIFNVQVTSNAKPAKQSRASTRRSASNVSLASSMTYWLDPTFSEEGPEKDTLNLFNNAADVMGTHANGVACSPFDGFAEVGASLDSYLLGHPPSEKKRGAPDGVTDDRAAQQPRVELELQPPSDDLFDIALGAFA